MKLWNDDEINFLKENANIMSADDIGLKLNRSANAIYHKLKRLGIQKQLINNKNLGRNDYKYIGTSYGCWNVKKRFVKKGKPYYLCENPNGFTKVIRQDYFKKMANKIDRNIPEEDISPTNHKDIYASKSGNIYREFYLDSGQSYFRKYSQSVSQGYLVICASVDGKRKNLRVHRLVAEAFIPNPNNLPMINHKDENKTNNNVENLEWCSCAYNNTYGERLKKVKITREKNIKQRKRVA